MNDRLGITEPICVSIHTDVDVVGARQQGRTLSAQIGFSNIEQVLIATVVSELARNIITYAGLGEILIEKVQNGDETGIRIIARDQGPGIANIKEAMQDGFSTSKSLGLGLPGSRRMMDEFEIISHIGQGTTVTAVKWLKVYDQTYSKLS